MPTRSWLRGLVVPLIVLFILFVAFVGYYRYWVPSRQRLLDDRGFRYLKTLSDQIRLTANTYDKMLDYAVRSGIIEKNFDRTQDNLGAFLRNVAPQLVLTEVSDANQLFGKGKDGYADPPKIAIQADEGTHFLYFAFRYPLEDKSIAWGKTLDFAVKTDLDQQINGLLGAPDLSPFDVVLISQGDGRVIFQKSLSGIEVSEIKELEDASGVKGKEGKKINNAWLSPASRLEEVWIAGARYRLYSQPLQVGFSPVKKTADTKPADTKTSDTNETWVLCGLVRADRFRSESQLIPYRYILMMLAAILLAAASYPFLKLYFFLPGERLRARDVTFIAVFACFLSAGLTLVLVDIYFWNRSFGQAAERDMKQLAHAINANFQREQAAAWSTLDAMNEILLTASKQSEWPRKGDIRVLYTDSSSSSSVTCDPSWACRANITSQDGEKSSDIETYPYLLYSFWSDSNGKQQIKWTTRSRPTPFISLDDPSVPYYPRVKRALKSQSESQTVLTQGIGSQYSPTTGQNITTFWKVDLHPKDKDRKPYKRDDEVARRYSYSLVTQPISLYNAVLPGGFQFAVLTPDGTVVFHSDTTRNLRENFFAETDLNPDLRSCVRMRSEGAVTANYIGRPHRMWVLPMTAANQDGLWTIVIFRDLHLEEVLNLEMLSLAGFLFLIYAAAITLVLICVHWMRRGQSSVWFWPDSHKARQYRWIAVTNLVAVVLLLLLSHFVQRSLTLLLWAAVIPAAALVLTVVMAGRRDDLQALPDEPDQSASNQWQSAYFQAAATLVMLIAVLPCICFFRVAANFEQRLLVKRTLLKLDGDLDNRALAVQALYQDVKLGEHSKATILAAPDYQNATGLDDEKLQPAGAKPVFSYHELLETSVSSEQQQPTSDGSAAKARSRSTSQRTFLKVMEFLLDLTHPYIESADDDRHMAEGKSDVWIWSSPALSELDRRDRVLTLMSGPDRRDRVLKLTKKTWAGEPARNITTVWRPFYFPWDDWAWWLGVAVLPAAVYWLLRLSFSRIFLFHLDAPPPPKEYPGLNPAALMAGLPMNLLIVGPDTGRPIASLIHRSDIQVREAEDLLQDAAAQTKAGATGNTSPAADPIDLIIRDGRPLVLRNFERLADNVETATKTHAALMTLLSAFDNSVILVSGLNPVMIPSIESSERWRTLLRSFVLIDLHSTSRQRIGEDEADYEKRIFSKSYFHWLFDGLPRPEKLVMLQLAQENVVNPNSSDTVYGLMEQGLIEGRRGLLTITDVGFAKFLPHAVPRQTSKFWETELAGTRPFSLQTSLLILGVGVVGFLVYTQGDLFNTWVTYASGVAAAIPKVLQFFDNLRGKTAAKS
jgi:hypothetical protein